MRMLAVLAVVWTLRGAIEQRGEFENRIFQKSRTLGLIVRIEDELTNENERMSWADEVRCCCMRIAAAPGGGAACPSSSDRLEKFDEIGSERIVDHREQEDDRIS